MIVLGIETSCDETAVGIVENGHILHANAVLSSMDLHKAYGGVVPEIAAREHIRSIHPVIEQALADAFGSPVISHQSSGLATNDQRPATLSDPWDQIDAIAVTCGAGLGGSLLVGVLTARTLAIIKNKPLYAINHVEAHVYANFLTKISSHLSSVSCLQAKRLATGDWRLPAAQPQFPCLALIVSGGHSQLVLFKDHFNYELLGQTHDDAIGEAFDKVAKILGLPYPGGPSIGESALSGDPKAYNFPKAKMAKKYDFSFSGIKTAVLRSAQEAIGQDFTFPSHGLSERLSESQKANIAASFQRVAIETVVDKTLLAFAEFAPKSVVVAGGVAASPELRRQMAERLPCPIEYTDPRLCTDNGAMIATLGCFKMKYKQPAADPYSLEIAPNLSM